MQRELLLLDEMAAAAEQAHRLVEGLTAEEIDGDRLRRDAPAVELHRVGRGCRAAPR